MTSIKSVMATLCAFFQLLYNMTQKGVIALRKAPFLMHLTDIDF